MLGLVLTAGGARGAYQAGVLKRIGEIPSFHGQASPFAIVTGASAGAINGTMIAAESADFRHGTQHLARLWADLRVHDVFHTDALTLGRGSLQWARDLILGGLIGGGGTQALLDATPLRSLLDRHLRLEGIDESIRQGHLYAVAVTATSYHSGRSFTFVQGRPGHPVWSKSRRVVLPVALNATHVRASAAIPIVFAPVAIPGATGELWFGDGGLRMVTPLSPAIRLGASRVFAIGIRSQRAAAALSRAEILDGAGSADAEAAAAGPEGPPPLAQICGVFLNAIFLDHLDTDIDHLVRMNELITSYRSHPGAPAVREPIRTVEPLVVSPSEDLALVAQQFAHKMPRMVRHMLDGLGTPDAQSADLMSYLLFDSAYTQALLDIGYCDAGERIDEIEAFLRAGAASVAA